MKTSFDGKVEETERIVEQQEKNIRKLEKEEQENREKAEFIYAHYQDINPLLSELKEIAKKHSWHDIKAKLKGHKTIKEVNPKEKTVVVEF